ncbi:MAG: hypothetical protein IJF21_01640 [Clostridia bacterium]|nr:hypothetical protein [Clostridia bacterium]MBQ3227827.1 hypothetical protein [Clostridia bacterium]
MAIALCLIRSLFSDYSAKLEVKDICGYCLWSDCPAGETEDELLENLKPYIRACGKKLR